MYSYICKRIIGSLRNFNKHKFVRKDRRQIVYNTQKYTKIKNTSKKLHRKIEKQENMKRKSQEDRQRYFDIEYTDSTLAQWRRQNINVSVLFCGS